MQFLQGIAVFWPHNDLAPRYYNGIGGLVQFIKVILGGLSRMAFE